MGYEFIIAGTGAELRLRVIEERGGGGEEGLWRKSEVYTVVCTVKKADKLRKS